MKNSILLFFALLFIITTTKAQTAMQLTGNDCNGVYHDLYADLDAGKAVLLHFFMTCAACPPPAQKIQTMANHVLQNYPGMITAYALGYTNSYSCATVANWVNTNGLPLYAPFDSGAAMVAYYGGFGMPTVVLLGGTDHRTMFATQSFSTSDTTIMRDSILALFNSTGVGEISKSVSSFNVYPTRTSDFITVNFELKEAADVTIDVADITGKQVAVFMNERQNGIVNKQFSVASLPDGNYIVRLQANGKISTQRLNINH